VLNDLRLAGAPISWGVCEVPGWGQMLPPDRVLGEMTQLGLRACELGPVGYLGNDPAAIKSLVGSYGLSIVGGFVPLVLHDKDVWAETEAEARRVASRYAKAGAECFVTAVVVDQNWSPPFVLDDAQWEHLVWALSQVDVICAEYGIRQVLHPHVGTLVETAADIERVLTTSNVMWCLDTGHLSIGRVDPVDFAAANYDRVGLVHLKDVQLELATRVRDHQISLLNATRDGLFCPLGQGDVPIGAVVNELVRHGYSGWYVIEQDMTIDSALDQDRPVEAVAVSLAYLAREVRHSLSYTTAAQSVSDKAQ